MKQYSLGLIVGKFSPLHLGHEHLITQAISLCGRVLVIGYSRPEFLGCEREQRLTWLQRRFPNVINIQIDETWLEQFCKGKGVVGNPVPANSSSDSEQRAWLAWLLKEVLELNPDAMLASENYVFPTCEVLSRTLGNPVIPICVDAGRHAYPISATRIRQDYHAHREWLHPDVYRDFVHRVVLLGGESSGKTTLAQALAEQFETCWVPEYGRELWDLRKGQLSLDDLMDIGQIQVEREESMLGMANRFLFCDTSPLTTLGYALWMHGEQPAALQTLATRPYVLNVLCEPDFDFVQDGTRQDGSFRMKQHAWYEAQLKLRGAPFVRVTGSVTERLTQIREVLFCQPNAMHAVLS